MGHTGINQLPGLPGQTVTIMGWVTTTRSSGKIAFVVVRDGSGYLQCVVSKRDVSDEIWTRAVALSQETSVRVTGTVRLDPRQEGGAELSVTELEVLGPSVDFPISPKEHGTSFLFEHRHLWLRSRKQVAIAKIRHQVFLGTHDFFDQRGFCASLARNISKIC